MTKKLLANKRKALQAIPPKRLHTLIQHLGPASESQPEQDPVDRLAELSGNDFGVALKQLTRAELAEMLSALGVATNARTKKAALVESVVSAVVNGEARPASVPAKAVAREPDSDTEDSGAGARRSARKPKQIDADEDSRLRQEEQWRARDQERAIREPGWSHIDAETLAELDNPDFAQLCHELLVIERDERHAPSTRIERAPEGGLAGTDLRCTVSDRPLTSAEQYARRWAVAPLIDDVPGVTLFRCKTGASWRTEVKRDAKAAGDEARQVLQAGGRLVIFCNESRKRQREKTPIERQLATAYARALKERKVDIADLEQRIDVVPADELALYLRCRRPVELTLESRDQLGVPRVPKLIEFETWASAHMPEHRALGLSPPPFQWDAARERVRDQLLRMLATPSEDPYSHVAWLDGPSGVGKTRLLLEILRHHEALRRRTLVAPSTDAAIAVLSAHRLFEQYPTALIIVEEGTSDGLAQLVPWLDRYNQRGIGGLIALTSMAEAGGQTSDSRIPMVFQRCRMDIGPLDAGAFRALIARELGAAPDSRDVGQVAEVTEGAPWLATLVAREVAAGAPLPGTATEAVELAIAGHHEPDREANLDLRVRVLLLMMLVGDVDWATLNSDDRESLCRAVGVGHFDDVEKGLLACKERGLLHVHLGPMPDRVTPAMVAREVAKKMLQPTVEGPAPQATPLGEHARRLLPDLYHRLEPLGLDRLIAVQLAAPIARALEVDAPGVSVIGPSAVGRAELVFATRYQLPQRITRVLGKRILDTSIEELRERVDIRSALVESMECLAARRWSFERAEDALFRLAQAENQALTNNATNTWANLFTLEHNQTYRAFLVRLSLLQRRMSEGTAEQRMLALEGLRAALEVGRTPLPVEPLDGPYPDASPAEIYTSRLVAWKLLIQLMTDHDPAFADRAGEIAVECLPHAVAANMGSEVAARLSDVAPLLAEPIQRGLQEAVRALQAAREAQGKHVSGQWDSLLEVLMPRNFMRSLRERVGAYTASSDAEAMDADRELARHGLSDPGRPLLPQLEWLVSDQAVRRLAFAEAVGIEDLGRIALDPLIDQVRQGRGADVLAAYLFGWQRANRGSEVAQVIRAIRLDSDMSNAVAMTIRRLGPSEENLGVLLELVDRGTVDDHLLHAFASREWLAPVPVAVLGQLVDALVAREAPATSELACALMLLRLGPAATQKKWRQRLHRALRGATRPGAELGVYWRDAALLLIDGDVDITELVLDAALSVNRPLASRMVWSVFHACARKNAKNAWSALVSLCLRADASTARRVARAIRDHGVAACFPHKLVTAWVGDDEGRAAWAARLIPMYESDELPVLAHKLLVRFGPASVCAQRLESGATQPPKSTADVADFHAVQIARARRWSQDSAAEVRVWAQALILRLEGHLQAHRA